MAATGDVIASRRLVSQRITGAGSRRPADVVAWCGAVQAQEYDAAKWGLGLRMRDGAVDSTVERAFERGEILRTHVMRPTWHFVTPDDIRWLLELTAPRVHRAMALYNRRQGLRTRTLVRSTGVIERALRDRQCLTRSELGDRLRRSKLVMAGMRLALLTIYAELEGVICSGPRRGKQLTYALLADRAPGARRLAREEALCELSRRYFRSHGPATIRDFVWWSGPTTADAKRGLAMNAARSEEVGGRTYWTIDAAPPTPARESLAHLLPIYDEYLVAYRDREAVPHAWAAITSAAGKPIPFQHAVVVAGQVSGTWRVTPSSGRTSIQATLLRRLTGRERRAVADAASRYERFRDAPVDVHLAEP